MRIAWVGSLVLALSGCQQDVSSLRPVTSASSPTAAVAQAITPATCPRSGAVLRTTTGREFTFLGRDPADPELCMWTVTGGRGVTRAFYGLWPTGDTQEFHRAGLRRMQPLAVGRETSYQSRAQNSAWQHTWRVIGQERITVPAGAFDVWVVERIEQGMFNNGFRGEQIYYVDQQTGAVVKLLSRVVRGDGGYNASWEAVSYTR